MEPLNDANSTIGQEVASIGKSTLGPSSNTVEIETADTVPMDLEGEWEDIPEIKEVCHVLFKLFLMLNFNCIVRRLVGDVNLHTDGQFSYQNNSLM